MPIQRSSIQKKITLEEFYQDIIDTSTNHYADVARGMIGFLGMVNDTFKETQLWGVTSHTRLCILKEDVHGDWYVIVANIGNDYYFEYLLPKHKQPWDNATVHGKAESLEEAKKYLLIAMLECEEWIENEELKRLLIDNGLT
jgi:hypothetical protein